MSYLIVYGIQFYLPFQWTKHQFVSIFTVIMDQCVVNLAKGKTEAALVCIKLQLHDCTYW